MAKERKIDMTPAINEALEALGKDLPVFRYRANYMFQHLDKSALKNKGKELSDYVQQHNISGKKANEAVLKGIRDYIKSGQAFDNVGRVTILNEPLEEKAKSGFFRGFFPRRALREEGKLNNIIEQAYEIGERISQKGFTMNEESAHSMDYLMKAGFMIPELRILRNNKKINNRQYHKIIRNISKNITAGSSQLKEFEKDYLASRAEEISKYAAPHSSYERAASLIFAFIGITLLVASGMNLTGGVTGTILGKSLAAGLIGSVAFVASLVLFILSFKKR